VDGLTFEEAVANATLGDFGGESVRFIGIAAQIVNKRAAGRMKDLADAEALEAIQAAKSE
jgi:hypothetical protein